MLIINHRVNNLTDLQKLNPNNGAETDVRDAGKRLVVSHDPYKKGVFLNSFLDKYNGKTLIINIKSEGIEFDVIKVFYRKKLTDYFFLDCSFAMINKFIAMNFKKFAIRFSEMESIETVRNFKGLADWVWVDCFTKTPLTVQNFTELKSLGFKICIVSPDLVGRPDEIESYAKFFLKNNLVPDAVCVKRENESFWSFFI
jgi:hypothetical protein